MAIGMEAEIEDMELAMALSLSERCLPRTRSRSLSQTQVTDDHALALAFAREEEVNIEDASLALAAAVEARSPRPHRRNEEDLHVGWSGRRGGEVTPPGGVNSTFTVVPMMRPAQANRRTITWRPNRDRQPHNANAEFDVVSDALSLTSLPHSQHEGLDPETMDFSELLELGERIGQASTRQPTTEELDRLPTRTFHAQRGTDHGHCAVCCEDFASEDEVRTLPCLHIFHVPCIDRWLTSGMRNAMSCPVCQRAIEL